MRLIGRFAASALAAAFCCLLAAPALAQNRAGTFEISPFGGGYFGGRLHAGATSVFSRDVDVRTDVAYGLRVGGNLSNRIGVEIGFSRSEADIEDARRGSHQRLGELDDQHYELNFLFNFGHRRVIPYVTAGAGASRLEIRVPGQRTDDDVRFTSNLGVGVKFFITPHFGIRLDGRGRGAYVNDRRCGNDDRDFCYWDDDRDNRDRRWYYSGEATGGLTFAF